jgi:hypothetical protein
MKIRRRRLLQGVTLALASRFQAIALAAKRNYPVSNALAGTKIYLTARLLNAR